jgi:hypothetical protein
LTMTARCMAYVLSGEPGVLRNEVPRPLADLIRAYAEDESAHRSTQDAWALAEQVSQVARRVFGPPAYHRLRLPGWDWPAQ